MRERIYRWIGEGPGLYIISSVCATVVAGSAIEYFLDGNPAAGIGWAAVTVYIILLTLSIKRERRLLARIDSQAYLIQLIEEILDAEWTSKHPEIYQKHQKD